jgi:dienelactone hydrolase
MTRRTRWLAALLFILVVTYSVRPARDFVWIAAGRAHDAVIVALQPSLLREKREHVVDRAIEQGDQIDAYLRSQRSAATQASFSASFDFSSADAYARSADLHRARLRESLRYPPPGFEQKITTPPTEILIGEDEIAVYRELRIPVLPGIESAGIYMRPKTAGAHERLPLVIAAAGRGGMPAPTSDGSLPAVLRSSRDLAWDALQHGYAVWLPVFVHYGRDGDDLRDRLTVRAWTANTSLPSIEIAKTVRAIDALTQRPDIDGQRVAMMGHSYGGFYTLYTAALEPRIRVAVVSAYFNDRESVLDASEPNGFLDWRYPDSLSLWRDPALVALIAPRPLLIEAGSQDQLFPIEGARRAAPQAAQFYARQGVADRFQFLEFAGRHDFNGKEALKFIDNHLAPGGEAGRGIEGSRSRVQSGD